METKYQWYFFDLDGTLTDPKEGITKCFQYALVALGKESPSLDELERYIGPPLLTSFREFFEEEAEAMEAVEKYRERFVSKGITENRVYEGMEEVLKAAKAQGKKLALATSKPQPLAEMVMEYFRLTPYFDVLMGALDDIQTKADVIRRALQAAGLQKEDKPQVIMVGDRVHDIAGAKECGLTSLGVRFGYARSMSSRTPERTLSWER